jgi:hypothetical protein
MWIRFLGGAAVLLLFGVSVTEAQERAGSFEQLRSRVTAGDEVTVTDVMGRETRGRILELSSSSLVLVADKTRTVFVQADVETVSLTDSRLNGILWGLGVGGVLGVLLDKSLTDEYGRDDISVGSSVSFIATAAGIGAGIGFVVDAILKGQRTIYSRPPTSITKHTTVLPMWVPRRQALVVVVRF